ncbi:MAG: FAD:protein FMN transferase, partial [Candidatus Omnitrophica bacterium]|nr:FAD:protein FMN transferase [Candidatus Omnitrophota bacterium]
MMMGTFIEVISGDAQAANIVFEEISRVEKLLSIYEKESEISQLNRRGRVKASPETLFVIQKAKEFWIATEGVFDVSVAPLVELWGFRDGNYRLPGDSEIQESLKLIGFDKIEINGNIIEFKIKGMKIDLGGIAKGYAVDSAVRQLMQAGINSALLNAGGDVYCLGNKQGMPWRVAIRSAQGAGIAGYLELSNKAVATSGSYEQYFSIGDSRYSHIMNPKTGRPVDSGVVSVSVIADDCLSADALATSIFILGKQKGSDLAVKFNA